MNPDPDTAQLLALIENADRPSIWELDPLAARAQNDPLSAATEHLPEDIDRVEDRLIQSDASEIPIRIFWPAGIASPAPVLVYCHGGGGVIGNIDTHDSLCRTLANESGCITISVEYRLGPEYCFPAGLHDAIAAFRWTVENVEDIGGDIARISIGGDSGGAGIAASVAQLLRKDKTTPACQLLICPALDASRDAQRYPSYGDNANGYFLDHALINWFQSHYLDDEQNLTDPQLSPVLNPDLDDLPPTVIITAGFDPLRDEGQRYSELLRDAGVTVDYRCYETTIHSFVSMGRFIPLAMEGLKFCGQTLRNAVQSET